MRTYRWVCHVCETGNTPESNQCSKCGLPAEVTGKEIELAKKIANSPKKIVNEPIQWVPLIGCYLAFLFCFGGWLISLASIPTNMKYISGIISDSQIQHGGKGASISIKFSIENSAQQFIYPSYFPNTNLAKDLIKPGNSAVIGFTNPASPDLYALSINNEIVIVASTANQAALENGRVSLTLSAVFFVIAILLTLKYRQQLPNPSIKRDA